jgi:hypothetical protein
MCWAQKRLGSIIIVVPVVPMTGGASARTGTDYRSNSNGGAQGMDEPRKKKI